MAAARPTWQLVTAAAERLTAAGTSPFKLEELVAEVQRLDPTRGRGTIQPTVQGMTVNAGRGPQVDAAAKGLLRRVEHGYYQLARRAGDGSSLPTDPPLVTHSEADGIGPPVPGAAPTLVAQEDPGVPAGSSIVQRDAEVVILAAAEAALGVRLTKRTIQLADGVRIEVDGASDDPPVLCEVWAHQGPAKVAQVHKVLHDALKLFIAAEGMAPRPRLMLILSDDAAAQKFRGASWNAYALQRLGVELCVVEIPTELRDRIKAAQQRQFR